MDEKSALDTLRQKVEWQALELIKRLTEIGKMTQEHAQRLAQHVLATVKPDMNGQDFFKGIFHLDDGFPELSFIVAPIAKKYETQIEHPVFENIRTLVKRSDYDHAIELANKLVSHDVKVKLVAHAKAPTKTTHANTNGGSI